MRNEDRDLIVEVLAEMRELKGKMHEFKEHVIGRVEKLEKSDTEHSKEHMSILSMLISSAALVISIIVNFFKTGSK